MQAYSRWIPVLLLLVGGMCQTSPAQAGEVMVPIGPYGRGIVLAEKVKSIKEIRVEGITLQKLDYSCGSAALSTVFTSYLNQPYSEAEIIDFIVRNGDVTKIAVRKGFSLLDLKRFAEAHGVSAVGYGLDYDSLLELKCPVLVPLYRKDTDMRHFVIFRGAIGDRVYLADPAMGRRTVLRSQFEQEWTPKVGMVFSHPDMPPAASSPLALGAHDESYLSQETLRAIALQSAVQYIHQANEF